MDYNFNIKGAIVKLLPNFLRKDRLQDFLYGITKKMQNLVNDTVLVTNFGQADSSFYQFTVYIQKFLRFNSQTIFLEKYLNDEYDTGASYPYSSTNSAIYVDNTAKALIYLFNIDEPGPNNYGYNIWRTTITYSADDYILYKNKIYKSLLGTNLNKQPGSETTYWEFYSQDVPYLYNEDEDSTAIDFTIYIPTATVYDEDKFNAQVNQYKTAGKTFQLIEY